MKIKSYHIASPEQLNELGVFAKDTERLKQIRSVWSIALRKKRKNPLGSRHICRVLFLRKH